MDGQAGHPLSMWYPFRSECSSEGRNRYYERRSYGPSPAHGQRLLEKGVQDLRFPFHDTCLRGRWWRKCSRNVADGEGRADRLPRSVENEESVVDIGGVTDEVRMARCGWEVACKVGVRCSVVQSWKLLKIFPRFNVGKGRRIREEEPYFHRSVRERMLVKELNYRPRARWNEGKEHYVD